MLLNKKRSFKRKLFDCFPPARRIRFAQNDFFAHKRRKQDNIAFAIGKIGDRFD
jgi:hypothetical protein